MRDTTQKQLSRGFGNDADVNCVARAATRSKSIVAVASCFAIFSFNPSCDDKGAWLTPKGKLPPSLGKVQSSMLTPLALSRGMS